MKSSAALRAARAFLDAALALGPLAIACDDDVDGLCAAVLLRTAFERKGGSASIVVGRPAAGETLDGAEVRERIEALPRRPRSLAVLDGANATIAPGPSAGGLALLKLDDLRGDRKDPRPPAGLLCHELVSGWAPVDDLEWLTALATFAELGSEQGFTEMNGASQKWGSRHIAESAALLNAARRAGDFQPEVALEALATAREPAELAEGRVIAAEALRSWRDDVLEEIERCMRSSPRFAGQVALIRFSSPAQVHPVVAGRWIRRLKRMMVMAVNDGYLPGRVSFALRTSDTRVDLVSFLRRASLVSGVGGLARGHPRAAGGHLAPRDFDRLLRALGFAAAAGAAARGDTVSGRPQPAAASSSAGRRRREPA